MTARTDKEGVIQRFVQAVLSQSPDGELAEELARRIRESAQLTVFQPGDVVVERDSPADTIHFLADGTLRYDHLVSDPFRQESVSSETIPWMPVGWSSMRFLRHRFGAIAETDGCVLAVPITAGRQLASQSPRLWAHVSEFMFRTAIKMLWDARGGSLDATAPAANPAGLEPIHGEDPAVLDEMYHQSPTFSGMSRSSRSWLAANTKLYRVEGGIRILNEGEPSNGLWFLQGGRVALYFTVTTPDGVRTSVRHRVRPGSLLAWSAASQPVPAPYGVETTRSTKLAYVPRSALAELFEREPRWVGDMLQQQLWTLRYFILSTRAEYGGVEGDGGIRSVSELIEDHRPVIPVDSELYGVPHLLGNKLTREQGFRQLYRAFHLGNQAERVLARLAIELLHDFERGHRFYMGMLSTYRAVVDNQHLEPARLRRISFRYFRDAASHVPYVIKGLENLPDDPNCIVIYNHMAYAEDSLLPNGFYFNPDSHFVSGVIMEPKYGDGIRIARTNANTEFWRANYYEPLGHIPVVTPESGWLEETPEEKQARKDKFFADCEAVLASGRPFGIAPEGTITEEDSVTERSPGPLKAGAFLMSAQLPSKPKIVPIALANFDKPAHRAIFSCVIKPAFTMGDRGVDVNDRAAMGEFLEQYRREFRGYVEEAIELAEYVDSPGADLRGVVTNLANVDAVHMEFEHQVRELEMTQSPLASRHHPTVFYGSSTIRLWEDRLGPDTGISGAVNLGFGGGTMEAGRHYLERLVVPYQPGRLVVYFGENDLAEGASSDAVIEGFSELADTVELSLPVTRCWFVSNKPSPARRAIQDRIAEVNAGIAAEVERRHHWRFIDWYPTMLDENGEPRPELFAPDQLHLNHAGYATLAGLLSRELPHDY